MEPAEASNKGGTTGAEPAESVSKAGGGVDPRDLELTQLREKYEAMAEENERHRSDWERLNSDPDIVDFVQARLAGRETGEDPIAALAKEKFGAVDEHGAWSKAMTDFGREIARRTREETLAAVEPRLRALDGTLAGSRFERGLADQSIPPETVKTREFKAHLKEMEGDAAFRTLKAKRPDAAARWAAAEWKLRAESRAVAKADNERLERAKGAKLNGGVQRGSAVTPPSFVRDARDPHGLSKTRDWVRANASKFPGGIQEALAHVSVKKR